MRWQVFCVLILLIVLSGALGCGKKPGADKKPERQSATEHPGQNVSPEDELSEVLHLSSVYSTLLEKYDVVARQLISTIQNPQRELLLNAINRTVAGLRVYKEGTIDGWGTSIPVEVMAASEVDLARYEGSVFSRSYADTLDRGMSGFGMVQSKKITSQQVTLLAKEFIENWDAFPKDAVLITQGWYKGFFLTPEGDLLIPGFSFYANIAEGTIDISSFKTTPSYPGHETESPRARFISAEQKPPWIQDTGTEGEMASRDRVQQREGTKSYGDLSKDEQLYVNTLVWKAANKLFGTAKSDIRITPYNLNPDRMQADGKQYLALAFPVEEPILSDMSKGYDLKNILIGSSIMYTFKGRSKELRIEEVIVQAIDFAARRETNNAGVENFIPAHREYLVFPIRVRVR